MNFKIRPVIFYIFLLNSQLLRLIVKIVFWIHQISLSSIIFSIPFFPITTGTPINRSLKPYSPRLSRLSMVIVFFDHIQMIQAFLLHYMQEKKKLNYFSSRLPLHHHHFLFFQLFVQSSFLFVIPS